MMAARGDASRLRPETVQRHEYWQRMRRESWARLDEPERLAWAAFGSINGQLALRETFYEGKDDKTGQQFAVLQGEFAERVLREWHDVPRWMVPRVWSGVLVLHDGHWQKGRDHESLCWHPDDPLAFCDDARPPGSLLRCKRCSVRFRCTSCWVDGVWHQHGS